MQRNLAFSEFIGWAKKVDLSTRCKAVIDSVDAPEQVKMLARIVLETYNETRLSVLYVADVEEVSAGLVATGIISADERTALVGLMDFDPATEALKTLADNIVAREDEVASYQTNIDNYQGMIETLNVDLPADWPADLVQYRGWDSQRVYAQAPDAVADTVIDLIHRDRLKFLLRGEKGEQKKSALVLAELRKRLPEGSESLVEDARRRKFQRQG